jgi:hypothetical protein
VKRFYLMCYRDIQYRGCGVIYVRPDIANRLQIGEEVEVRYSDGGEPGACFSMPPSLVCEVKSITTQDFLGSDSLAVKVEVKR